MHAEIKWMIKHTQSSLGVVMVQMYCMIIIIQIIMDDLNFFQK